MGMEILLAFMAFLSITMLIYVMGTGRAQTAQFQARLSRLTSQDQGVTFEEELMSRSIQERLIIPFFAALGKFFTKYSPTGTLKRTQTRLAAAGFSRVDPLVFLGARVVAALALTGLVAALMVALHLAFKSVLFFFYLAVLVGFFMPDIWLRLAGEQRKAMIRKQLPDLLDLLTVTVEAGLGFDQALALSAEKMNGPLIVEVRRTFHEIQMGMSRVNAMRALAVRTNLAEMSAFVASLIQADELGVPIANVLRVQSDSIRTKRRQYAEEKAMKAPLKMLFPLLLFVFPTLFIVILAPAVLNLIENFKVK